jgi:ATP/maltotriose-dependent transcriptional regulator MalT/DNA-binding SARP family transcriptional activator
MAASEVPISKTKILIPRRRAELLTRTRLLDILYERLDRRLIIVSAPAGYGKTSLLIDLAHHSELPFCWLALDALDRDPQRFIAYLIAALRVRFPKFGKRSVAALNGLTSLEEGMEPLLVTLVNEIRDDVSEHFALVLDDFHYLDEAQAVYAFVNRFVQLMDESCHLVLSSRTLPELQDIPLLVARDEVGGLDFSDLSFQPEEIQELLSQNQHLHLSESEAQKLAEETEGWITGLQFADVGRVRAGASAFPARAATGVSVFDYLGRQVLENQPQELQTFLLRSSLLEEFDATLCEAVLSPLYEEPQDWPQLTETILQKNLFALPVGVNGQAVRYHHLFGEYLQGKYRRDHPEEVGPVLRRLAQFRESLGDWEAAYELYKQLGDSNAVADLVERAGIPMYQNAMLTLERWLKELPPSLARQRPGLLSLRGTVATMKGNATEGADLLNRAIGQLRHGDDTSGLALALVRRGNAQRFLGRYDDATADGDEAMRLTDEHDDLQWIYEDALRLRGLSLYRQGHTFQALDDLDRALDICVRINDASNIPMLLMETGMAQAAIGSYREAQLSLEKALDIWKRAGNLMLQANLLNNLGFLYYQLGEYEKSAQTFEEGLLCARRSGYKRMEALITISMGDLYSEIEDFEIAAQNYHRIGELVEQLGDRFLINYLAIAEANLALLKREPSRARLILERAYSGVCASDSNYEYGHYELARGRLSLEEDNAARALEELAEAKRCFVQDGREMEGIWGGLWLAAAYCKAGRAANAAEEVRAVLQAPNQIKHAAVVATRQAQDWLEGLRSDRELRPLLRDLFDRVDRLDDRLPGIRRQLRRMTRTIEVPAPTLAIRAFGRGQVWASGKLITASEWQTKAVRELFFYFLAMNKPVTKEQVGSVLWPETNDPARLRLRFKNEIYRLRRAVGQEAILYDDEYYQLNPAIDHEYDVESFEAYLSKAQTASSPSEKITYYNKAIPLVGGGYLEDIDALWVTPERERLRQAFLAAQLALAELYLKEGQYADGLEVCQRILGLDATDETAYRLKMQLHGRLGDRAALIRTYQTCEEKMREVFDQPPSEETQAVYHKLIT